MLGEEWGDASPATSVGWLRLRDRLTRSMCGETTISIRGGNASFQIQEKLILYLPHAQVVYTQHLEKHHQSESSHRVVI